jgi:hypothetical protein
MFDFRDENIRSTNRRGGRNARLTITKAELSRGQEVVLSDHVESPTDDATLAAIAEQTGRPIDELRALAAPNDSAADIAAKSAAQRESLQSILDLARAGDQKEEVERIKREAAGVPSELDFTFEGDDQ